MGLQFLPHLFQQRLHPCLVKAVGHGQKFVSAVASHKVLRRDSQPQLVGKAANIVVSLLVAHAVVDMPQIVQVEAAHAHIALRRSGRPQQLLAPVFVGQPRSLVQIHLLLQRPVLGHVLQCLHQFIADQQHQAHNIRCDIFLQHRQRRCPLLGILLRQPGGLVAYLKKLLAICDNLCIFVANLPHPVNFPLQSLEIAVQLLHLKLKGCVVQLHQLQFLVSVAQAVNKPLHIPQHLVLSLACNLHFHQSLGLAPHKSRIVHHPGRALNAGHQKHHSHNQPHQHRDQHANADPRSTGAFFLLRRHFAFSYFSFGPSPRRIRL